MVTMSNTKIALAALMCIWSTMGSALTLQLTDDAFTSSNRPDRTFGTSDQIEVSD